jgi:tryptophan synthase alpha chain
MVGSLRRRGEEIPIVLFTYYNPIYKFGLADLASAAAESGVDGFVIPDLPPDEADGLREEAKRWGLDTIFLLAPTSTVERIRLVATSSTGFIYYVSRTGVTGEREKLSSTIERSVEAIRSYTDTPIAVGFGVSRAEQVRDIARIADGVIVGSAIVRAIEENIDRPDLVSTVGELVSGFVRAMDV